VTLDSMAEYQVQTHQYGAEYGGSTGVVVNSVTRSGTNKLAGRAFEYFQDSTLTATDHFLKLAGEENPDSGSNVYGGSLGGPIRRNKAFFFFNFEYDRQHEAANPELPGRRRAARQVVLDDDRFHRAELVPAPRLPAHAGEQRQLPLDARGDHHPARLDRIRQGDPRRRATRTTPAIRCSAWRGPRC
jgi:hypothetical protein